MMTTKTTRLLADTLPLTFSDAGEGRPYLLLHGGMGPASMMGLGAALARTGRAIIPVHPGFDQTTRPDWFHRIDDLVLAYLALIEQLALTDVTVVGNSVGGWIAAELGLRQSSCIKAIVLLDAVGMEPTPETGAIADPAQLGPSVLNYSFHDPATFASAPQPPDAATKRAANQNVLTIYAGQPFMHDPGLGARLSALTVPALVLWGESDRIVTPTYGRQFAELMPSSVFKVLPKAGHFPQIEQMPEVVTRITDFTA